MQTSPQLLSPHLNTTSPLVTSAVGDDSVGTAGYPMTQTTNVLFTMDLYRLSVLAHSVHVNVVLPVLHCASVTLFDVALSFAVYVVDPTTISYFLLPAVLAELHGHPQLPALLHLCDKSQLLNILEFLWHNFEI